MPDEWEAATARLVEMLQANTHEALGEEAAARARSLCTGLKSSERAGKLGAQASSPALPPDFMPPRGYGDGHLHPHEWLVDSTGRLFKVDGAGHDCDHTLVGKQPVTWDLAGAVVEWGLTGEQVERLLRAFDAAGGGAVDLAELRFYHAAYLAFRAGQCSLAAQVHDPYERPRLWEAYARYRDELAALLNS